MLISLGKKEKIEKSKKKTGIVNTYDELLSEKWIVKVSRFQAPYIISPLPVAILATFNLAGCIKY